MKAIYKKSKVVNSRLWQQFALPHDAYIVASTMSSCEIFIDGNMSIAIYEVDYNNIISLKKCKKMPNNLTSFYWEPNITIPAEKDWYVAYPNSGDDARIEIYRINCIKWS